MVKLVIATRFCAAWMLFAFGDAVSRIQSIMPGDWAQGWLYRHAYNPLMVRSSLIQGDGPGPWETGHG